MCGMMTPDAARAAIDAGADAIGMILHAPARRRIELSVAERIVRVVPAGVSAIGVFVDAPALLIKGYAAALGLSAIQLHGDEPVELIADLHPLPVIRAIRCVGIDVASSLIRWRDLADALPNLRGLLLDSGAGGSGQSNDWDALAAALPALQDALPVVLAGGLTPQTVPAVVRRFRPYMVDVSSGIECEHGRKSPEKMRAFHDAVAQADLDTAAARPA